MFHIKYYNQFPPPALPRSCTPRWDLVQDSTSEKHQAVK